MPILATLGGILTRINNRDNKNGTHIYDLPVEVRQKIWTEALSFKHPLARVVKRGEFKKPFKNRHQTALLRTCQRFRDECIPIFYRQNTFVINWNWVLFKSVELGSDANPLLWTMAAIPERHLHHLRSVILTELVLDQNEHPSRYLSKVLDRFEIFEPEYYQISTYMQFIKLTGYYESKFFEKANNLVFLGLNFNNTGSQPHATFLVGNALLIKEMWTHYSRYLFPCQQLKFVQVMLYNRKPALYHPWSNPLERKCAYTHLEECYVNKGETKQVALIDMQFKGPGKSNVAVVTAVKDRPRRFHQQVVAFSTTIELNPRPEARRLSPWFSGSWATKNLFHDLGSSLAMECQCNRNLRFHRLINRSDAFRAISAGPFSNYKPPMLEAEINALLN